MKTRKTGRQARMERRRVPQLSVITGWRARQKRQWLAGRLDSVSDPLEMQAQEMRRRDAKRELLRMIEH
jgi:hypothetical protein